MQFTERVEDSGMLNCDWHVIYHFLMVGKRPLSVSEVKMIPGCPPNTLDVSLIENLWVILKVKIRDVSTLEELETELC
ncbi:hypothetical protein E2C01_043120 [Portunus trituberculatus]|uniref:Uncharacterized protein n=1 Tax=Portunus trituberculatus TaxID=210409 RepID=A0A5B7FS29_PORTR|nr:hypothetical protein [Portunus trituberculatus]